MKKAISLVLALTLVFALCVPALAADTVWKTIKREGEKLLDAETGDSTIYTKTTKDKMEPEDPTKPPGPDNPYVPVPENPDDPIGPDNPPAQETVERFIVRIPAETEIPWDAGATKIPYQVWTQFGFGKHLEIHIAVSEPTDAAEPLKGTMKHDEAGTIYHLPYELTGAAFIAAVPNVHDTSAAPVSIENKLGQAENIYFREIDELTVNIAEADWAGAIVSRYEDQLTFTAEVVADSPAAA